MVLQALQRTYSALFSRAPALAEERMSLDRKLSVLKPCAELELM